MNPTQFALTAFLFTALTTIGCAPNYTRPDHDGRVPRGTTIDSDGSLVRDPFHVFSDPEQTRIRCGKTLHLSLSASAPVESCEGASYFAVYQHTVQPASAAFEGKDCEPDCRKRIVETFRRFSCMGNRVTVDRKVRLACLKPDESLDGLTEPYGDEWKVSTSTSVAGENDDFSARPDGELFVERLIAKPATYTLGCPDKMTFSVNYQEKDPVRCASIDYKPYVDRAVEAARSRYVYVCGDGCARATELSVLRTEWSCDASNGMVSVPIVFEMVCKKN